MPRSSRLPFLCLLLWALAAPCRAEDPEPRLNEPFRGLRPGPGLPLAWITEPALEAA